MARDRKDSILEEQECHGALLLYYLHLCSLGKVIKDHDDNDKFDDDRDNVDDNIDNDDDPKLSIRLSSSSLHGHGLHLDNPPWIW